MRLAPPPEVVPNFSDPDNLNTEIIVVLTLSLTLSTLAVSMRIWTKCVATRQLVIEDCTIEQLFNINYIYYLANVFEMFV